MKNSNEALIIKIANLENKNKELENSSSQYKYCKNNNKELEKLNEALIIEIANLKNKNKELIING